MAKKSSKESYKFQCYSCHKWITKDEAFAIKELYDKVMDEADTEFTENLAGEYVHCIGPKQQFFEDGGIVLCGKCTAEDIIKAIE